MRRFGRSGGLRENTDREAATAAPIGRNAVDALPALSAGARRARVE